jgi:uncharacterized membrane protein SpoIIM required for sporulation/uncharacterized RDD family membrane protein YckC
VAALDNLLRLPTPEHAEVVLRPAGPLVRLLAYGADTTLRVIVVVVLALPLIFLGGIGIGAILLVWFVLDWLVGGYIEWRWEGRTPGKRWFGVRVVGADGLPAGLAACMLRNLLRYADSLPTAATAVVAMLVGGRFQRLGDLVADTLVVHDGDGWSPAPPAADKAAQQAAAALPPELATAVDGPALRALVRYAARRGGLSPARRQELAMPFATALARRLGAPRPADPDLFLRAALHRLGAVGGDAAGEARSAGARAALVVARRRPRWARLEQALAGGAPARPGPDEAADEAPPARLAALYRGACADLALADAYHLPEPTVAYLQRLVARAHLRFYRGTAMARRGLAHLLLVEVPGRLYGDTCLRVAMAAFFGTFLLCALWGLADPERAVALLGGDFADDLREMYAEAPRGRDLGQGGMMAGFYIHNNVGIALACFASGIFLGIGSLVWLAANGCFLGLAFGFMGTVDAATRAHFFEFVSAHGPFELGGIALSGAAGLRLGLGLFDRGSLTLAAGLARAARRAFPILAAAAALVAAAAPIEAFVSPADLPLWVKRTVMAVCAVLMVGWLAILGRRGHRLLGARGEAA